MIGFDLTDEQRRFRDLARDFSLNEIRPIAAEYDELEEVPWEVLGSAAQTGLFSFYIPENFGGGGITDTLTYAIVKEELSWGCAAVASIIGGSSLCATPILLAGDEDQKSQFLPLFCNPRQPYLGAFALTEPSAGSDAANLVTEARLEGNHYVINGAKTFITNGGIADLYILFATLDISLGSDGITAFIVEKDTPGLVPGKKEKKMGIRASNTTMLTFDNMQVPVQNRLGKEGEGFRIAMRTFERTRTHVASSAVGLARAAFEYALDYAQQRIQFGKPIINHQAVGFMLADMATQIDAARLLIWRAASLADQGEPCIKQASMAKAFAADVAMKVTTDAVQILGGYGYSREYPVEKWMRDAKIMQIYEGTAEIQRLIISRQLAKT